MTSSRIYTVETHDEVLGIMGRDGIREAQLVHVDFHCDMRGLLIDRRRGRAYRIWDRNPDLDEGNYLAHAVLGGMVREVLWIHDEPGGRQDDLQTVKYESDVTAFPHRLLLALRDAPGVPIEYREMTAAEWDGKVEGRVLDIDWDYFAAREYERDSVEARVERFLLRSISGPPRACFVCYSADYCHPTRALYMDFVTRLAHQWQWEVVQVSRPARRRSESPIRRALGPLHVPARNAYRAVGLGLRRRGLF